ncbi:single-stranded DNA-binding protein [Pedobacter insulae]|uniref:Single-stranded DNA-binding protein n=1 Tax=Pedobacter insulae TaxID=414048 RepID=A0A1I2ZHZ8_9SPHI|nr:single-stranded DNA-binding protein [Pedobacter insulae]SFH37492.1 single-strand DNA-binding protein [Pedobacter insulae]
MNIIGRLTRDAEVNTLPSEKQVVRFSVAVNDSYRNKQGEQVKLTEYFNCAYWLAPKVAKALTKGTLVELTGRVSASAWLGRDGEAHASLNFHTSNIRFFGGGRNSEAVADRSAGTPKPSAKKTKDNSAAEDDLPF